MYIMFFIPPIVTSNSSNSLIVLVCYMSITFLTKTKKPSQTREKYFPQLSVFIRATILKTCASWKFFPFSDLVE